MEIDTSCCITTPPNPPTRTDTPVTTTGTALQPLSSNDPGTSKEHVGTMIATMDPYETPAPEEPQILGPSAEATTQHNPETNTRGEPQPQPGPSGVVTTQKNSKGKKKGKRLSKAVIMPQLSYLVGTNSETWTRFHVLNFDEEESLPIPNSMKMWTDLHRKLKSEFSCSRRTDGSILIDAKTRENAEELQKISHICDNSVTTTRDLRLNSTRATVLVPERVQP